MTKVIQVIELVPTHHPCTKRLLQEAQELLEASDCLLCSVCVGCRECEVCLIVDSFFLFFLPI